MNIELCDCVTCEDVCGVFVLVDSDGNAAVLNSVGSKI
jgi:hypothetical protein